MQHRLKVAYRLLATNYRPHLQGQNGQSPQLHRGRSLKSRIFKIIFLFIYFLLFSQFLLIFHDHHPSPNLCFIFSFSYLAILYDGLYAHPLLIVLMSKVLNL